MYDAAQFNGFARNELDNLLFDDIWNHDVFNESDLHSAAYYYIRTYFQRRGSDGMFVRCEPRLRKFKPDIVVYREYRPEYLVELKMFTDLEVVVESKIQRDLAKMQTLMHEIESIKWGFFILVYDHDDHFGMSDQRLRRHGFEKMSVSSINMRRNEGSGRRRIGYDGWRTQFDRLRNRHGDW
jgi:hypothetical protein